MFSAGVLESTAMKHIIPQIGLNSALDNVSSANRIYGGSKEVRGILDIENKSENLSTKVVWDISDFSNQKLALEFVNSLKSTLCVFSNTLSHIYGEYDIETVRNDGLSLVVVPHTYSLERYTHIPEDAVKPTGIYVFPGWYHGHKAPFVMTMLIKGKNGLRRTKPILPESALQVIEKSKPGKPFLPLLMRGDLREFNQRTPYVHLHRLEHEFITTLSTFDRGQLAGLILDKRKNLCSNVTTNRR